MAFTKITGSDTAGKGVVGLPDTPGLSTAAMQAKFDELATDVIIPKHNSLIDELEATTAAASIGVVNTTHTSGANVKAILDALDTYSTTLNTNMKTYVDGKDTAMKSYVDGKDSAMKTYVDNKDTAVRSYVDGKVATINSQISSLTTRMDNVESNVASQNAKIFNIENVATQALNTANTANTTAQTAEHDALTALQSVDSILTLLEKLLGHVYVNTETDDRITCENGDRICIDY